MSSTAQAVNPPRKRSDVEMIPRLLLPLFVGLSLFVSCFINIILEWIGMLFGWWNEPGAGHSAAMLRYEVQLLNDDFKDVIGIDSLPTLVDKIHWLLFEWDGIDYQDDVLKIFATGGVLDYGIAAINVIQIFSVRIGVLLFSLPVFLAFGLVAMTDGLLQRDLRKFGGGRESSYIWHRAKHWVASSLIIPIMIYLSSPWSIYPPLIIIPFAILFSAALWVTSAMFKKYL